MNKALPTDTNEVLKNTRRFEENELRKVLYSVARQKRESGDIRDAIKIILLGWNWRSYAGSDISNEQINQQIEKFIKSQEQLIEYFVNSDQTLETIEFDRGVGGTPIDEHIINGFNELLENKAIGTTGASKAFHMLYPTVFMMWDKAITEEYHREGEPLHWESGANRGEHKRGEGECYVNFLKETQQFVETTLDMDRFRGKTPAKVMDEYNYAKYTL